MFLDDLSLFHILFSYDESQLGTFSSVFSRCIFLNLKEYASAVEPKVYADSFLLFSYFAPLFLKSNTQMLCCSILS